MPKGRLKTATGGVHVCPLSTLREDSKSSLIQAATQVPQPSVTIRGRLSGELSVTASVFSGDVVQDTPPFGLRATRMSASEPIVPPRSSRDSQTTSQIPLPSVAILGKRSPTPCDEARDVGGAHDWPRSLLRATKTPPTSHQVAMAIPLPSVARSGWPITTMLAIGEQNLVSRIAGGAQCTKSWLHDAQVVMTQPPEELLQL